MTHTLVPRHEKHDGEYCRPIFLATITLDNVVVIAPPPPLSRQLICMPTLLVVCGTAMRTCRVIALAGGGQGGQHLDGRGLTTLVLPWAYRPFFWWGAHIGNRCGTHRQSCAMSMSHRQCCAMSMSHHQSCAMSMSHCQSRAMSMSHRQCGDLIVVKVFCCDCLSEKAFL